LSALAIETVNRSSADPISSSNDLCARACVQLQHLFSGFMAVLRGHLSRVLDHLGPVEAKELNRHARNYCDILQRFALFFARRASSIPRIQEQVQTAGPRAVRESWWILTKQQVDGKGDDGTREESEPSQNNKGQQPKADKGRAPLLEECDLAATAGPSHRAAGCWQSREAVAGIYHQTDQKAANSLLNSCLSSRCLSGTY
jgi:hypothetical protein